MECWSGDLIGPLRVWLWLRCINQPPNARDTHSPMVHSL